MKRSLALIAVLLSVAGCAGSPRPAPSATQVPPPASRSACVDLGPTGPGIRPIDKAVSTEVVVAADPRDVPPKSDAESAGAVVAGLPVGTNVVVCSKYTRQKDGMVTWTEVVLDDPDDPKIDWKAPRRHAGWVLAEKLKPTS